MYLSSYCVTDLIGLIVTLMAFMSRFEFRSRAPNNLTGVNVVLWATQVKFRSSRLSRLHCTVLYTPLFAVILHLDSMLPEILTASLNIHQMNKYIYATLHCCNLYRYSYLFMLVFIYYLFTYLCVFIFTYLLFLFIYVSINLLCLYIHLCVCLIFYLFTYIFIYSLIFKLFIILFI